MTRGLPKTRPRNAFALGRLKAGKRNKTEAAYELLLEQRRIAGEVAWYRFEGITLKLADDCRYTPDFAVMLANYELELHEVKGYWTDDAKVKTKLAAELFPFRIVVVKKNRTGWVFEEF